MSSPAGRLAACLNQQSHLCTSSARMLVRQRRRRRSTDGEQFPRLTRRMRRLLLLSRNSNTLSLASRTGHASQPLSKIERTTAWVTLPFLHHNISRRDQNCKREYAEQSRLILLLISSVNWPLTTFCREKKSFYKEIDILNKIQSYLFTLSKTVKLSIHSKIELC